MMHMLRDFRLLPVVLLAAAALLVLKSYGLIFDGGYVLGPKPAKQTSAPAPDTGESGDIVGSIGTPVKSEPPVPDEPAVTAPLVPAGPPEPTPPSRQSWAQEMFNFPDITGSVSSAPKKGAAPPGPTAVRNESAAKPNVRTAAKSPPDKPGVVPDHGAVSPSERAILARLQERRKDLEARARDLDMRESLLKAAEKRLQGRVNELKNVEGRLKVASDKKDDVTAERFKGLVAMYENMKAKDAARIFDRLDLKILAELAGHINPRRMSDILANMSPEAAEKLTVEFASRGNAPEPAPADLPKIEGRPNPGP